jgi:hypothetical protein
MKVTLERLLISLVLLALIPLSAKAQTPVTPGESCLAVEHFPEQPVNNAPSKAVILVALPPEWGGGTILVVIDGASGMQTGGGAVAPDGLAIAKLPLFSFGPHQIVNFTTINENLSGPVDIPSLVNGGAFTVDESEPACDPDAIARLGAPITTTASTTTTTAPTTTTTTAPTTTATSTPTTTTAAPDIEGGTSLLPWLFIALGGLLAVIGLFLLAKRSCDALYRLWQAAQRRYETSMEELTKSQAWLEEKRAERQRIQEELERMRHSVGMGSIIDGGATYQLLPGEGLVTDEGMAAIIKTTGAQFDSIQQSVQMGEDMVNEWRLKTEEAAAETESARKGYDDCIGAASPKASGTATPTTATGATTTTGGGVVVSTTTTQRGCPQGDRRAVPLADAKTFRVIRAFRIETEAQGEAMVGDAGQQLAADLKELGAELGFLGSLLGAHGAGKRVGESLVQTGSAANLVRGGVEGYLAAKGNLGTDSFSVPVPTSPQEVVVGVLQLIAQLAGTVATKANEWMDRRSFVSYRLVQEHQMVSVRPYKIEECDGQTYQCVETIIEYQIGDAGEQAGNWRDGGTGINQMERDRQQRELLMLINQGKSAMERSAQAILEFEARNPPGPC